MNFEVVKDYYGKVLKSSQDLKSSACCGGGGMPAHLEALLANVHEEVRNRYYGCGIVVPQDLRGARVLDLGSGSGRDVYLISQLVGPSGEVVGVDMTDEQLAVAESHIDWHMRTFGYPTRNVRFLKGYIEKLSELELAPGSFDVIVSNCVINLSIDKLAVLCGAFDLLKPGGELFFADVYCDRRLSDAVRADPLLYGECLGGALYWNDFLPMAKRAGFLDPRLVTSRPITVENEAMRAKLGQAKFFSATYRLFKLEGLESSLRGLRPGGPLQGHRARAARRVRARRASPDRARQSVPGMRKHLAHVGQHALCPAFRFHRRFRHALRHLPGLRHVDPVRHKCRGEVEWGLLLGFRPQLVGGQCNTT